VQQSLLRPIDSVPVKNLVSAGERAVIIISDSTRASASDVILPILVEQLNSAGIPDDNIDIVVALGIHRPQTEEEKRTLTGRSIFDRIRVFNHDAYDSKNLVSIGTTSRGTPVSISRIVAEADRIITVGSVVPHYFAGFGGGRKSIMPGICSHEANLRSHFLVFDKVRGRNPSAKTAQLAGNPVHEDMLEAAEMIAPDFTINSVLTPEKELCAVFAGELVRAHQEACASYLQHFSTVVSTAGDLTIVDCGGHPKDINFIQAHKAIQSAYSITRRGGWMIVLAECPEGFGYPGFVDWFRYNSIGEFERALRRNYEIYGQTAYAMYEKATSVNIVLVSDLAPQLVERMSMHAAPTFDEAYALAAGNLGEDFTTYVIPASSASLFHTRAEHEEAVISVKRYRNGNGEKNVS